MQVDNVEQLTDPERSDVLSLVETATEVDGTAPLSEQVLLAVRGALNTGSEPARGVDSAPGTDLAPGTGSRHFLAYAGTRLAGYAHLERGSAGEAATAELVVSPAQRRQGVGTDLLRALEAAVTTSLETAPAGALDTSLETAPAGALDTPLKTALENRAEPLQIWSHGHLDPARAFALRDGYSSMRELWQMHRPLRTEADDEDHDSLPAVSIPEGFQVRTFVVGQDEEAWLRLNARAFVHHPEQGRMTRQDLDQRVAEPWFEPAGFILIEDTRGPSPVLAASHWTKVVRAQTPQAIPAPLRLGEVYVVGVDPAYQGLGLGRTVTVLGLAHLRGRGLTEAMLYVDADNRAAVATYTRLGFTRCAVDVMYSPTVHPPV